MQYSSVTVDIWNLGIVADIVPQWWIKLVITFQFSNISASLSIQTAEQHPYAYNESIVTNIKFK